MSELTKLRDTASLFSTSTIKRLISEGKQEFLVFSQEVEIRDSRGNDSIRAIFDSAYSKLLSSYRNEYVYKNAIADKLIRGTHRFSKNCYYSTEFRVANSLADVVVANGTTTVFEIKTEFDSFERLDGQISDYSKAFDHIHVVIPEKKIDDWEAKIPRRVGVTVLSDKYTLQELRPASSNIEFFELEVMFSCFRRAEFITAIENQFGYIPTCKPVELKARCRELFLTLAPDVAHQEFLAALKSRQMRCEKIELLKNAPSSLTSVLISANLSLKEMARLNEVLGEGV
ncbi:sce7726 family protein [Vibrio parahaemolyticus]|uniref:sce7726 family protein n=1 Tax=Vibrio parahaemolyticus TaxID=670 RepID=UPI0006909782|nr:sce7726 family protein [Vibrio parahaemolyticus]